MYAKIQLLSYIFWYSIINMKNIPFLTTKAWKIHTKSHMYHLKVRKLIVKTKHFSHMLICTCIHFKIHVLQLFVACTFMQNAFIHVYVGDTINSQRQFLNFWSREFCYFLLSFLLAVKKVEKFYQMLYCLRGLFFQAYSHQLIKMHVGIMY